MLILPKIKKFGNFGYLKKFGKIWINRKSLKKFELKFFRDPVTQIYFSHDVDCVGKDSFRQRVTIKFGQYKNLGNTIQ
jgi:hypothetical protein